MAKKNIDKSSQELKKLNKTYFDLKMKHSSSALKETHKLSEARKDIARIKTKINQETVSYTHLTLPTSDLV